MYIVYICTVYTLSTYNIDISQLNQSSTLAKDIYGTSYLPGFIGLNSGGNSGNSGSNTSNNGYIAVILQLLSHVVPLRDYCLLDEHNSDYTSSSSGNDGVLLLQVYGVYVLWCILLSLLYGTHIYTHI